MMPRYLDNWARGMMLLLYLVAVIGHFAGIALETWLFAYLTAISIQISIGQQ